MKEMPQGRYTKEFREEAIKLVTEEKLSLPTAACRLSLSPSTLRYRVISYQEGRIGEAEPIGALDKGWHMPDQADTVDA